MSLADNAVLNTEHATCKSNSALSTLAENDDDHSMVAIPNYSHETGMFADGDYSYLKLKPDHSSRPLWICPESRHIILETFSPIAEQVNSFLIAIAEPVSRPLHIHEYVITPFSLGAALSSGLTTNEIITVLNKLSKSPVPDSMVAFIDKYAHSYGKVRMVLVNNAYYVESSSLSTLQLLLRDPVVVLARTTSADSIESVKSRNRPGIQKTIDSSKDDAQIFTPVESSGISAPNDGDEDDMDSHAYRFKIKTSEYEQVRERCNTLGCPMLEEYDFHNDRCNPDLGISLQPKAKPRPYQVTSLSKMFGNGRARSGIIVLPCGAGKTLVGIAAACTINKSIICLCNSSVSAMQWKEQFLHWSTITESQIAVFTSNEKTYFQGNSGIVITTYSMVAATQDRSKEAQQMLDLLDSREWGLLLLDEVHITPAKMFRSGVSRIKAHTKLGLTATLLREDNKIGDLNFLVGPKLYEANWMDLANQGHIATVQCAEMWCAMPAEFYSAYLDTPIQKRALLCVMNPNKLRACQYLIKFHANRGDKTIVFVDDIFALFAYAKLLNAPYIYGGTPLAERVQMLKAFQHNPQCSTILLSKIGDTSIDLPQASCLIQVSSHFGSRRQEAQRMGRILRANGRHIQGFNAYFYTLVSKDTQEMHYSSKRQQFLADQGYEFKVISKLEGMEDCKNLALSNAESQKKLLKQILVKMRSASGAGGEHNSSSALNKHVQGRNVSVERHPLFKCGRHTSKSAI